MESILIFLYILISVFVLSRIVKIDRLFAVFLFFVCIYSLIPAINIVCYEERVKLHGYETHKTDTVSLYLLYIVLTLVFLYISYLFVLGNSYRKYLARISNKICIGKLSISNFSGISSKMAAWAFLLTYILYLIQKIIRNRSAFSYANQSDGIIFKYMISLFGIFVYILLIPSKKHRFNLVQKCFGVLLLAAVMIYAVLAGERGSVLIYFVGFMYVFVEKNWDSLKRIKLRGVLKMAVLAIGIVFLSQIIRVSRGSSQIVINTRILLDFFQPEVFLFQDYSLPGYELMYCIENNMIRPDYVLMSFLGNGIAIFDYPTLGYQIPLPGYADFCFIEGYMFAGWLGVVLYPILVCCWFKLYYSLFLKSGDTNYKLFIGFLMASFFTIHFVRGAETFLFLKALYMYFIPSAFLYQMMNGRIKVKEILWKSNIMET